MEATPAVTFTERPVPIDGTRPLITQGPISRNDASISTRLALWAVPLYGAPRVSGVSSILRYTPTLPRSVAPLALQDINSAGKLLIQRVQLAPRSHRQGRVLRLGSRHDCAGRRAGD